jgi:hypothetical protein
LITSHYTAVWDLIFGVYSNLFYWPRAKMDPSTWSLPFWSSDKSSWINMKSTSELIVSSNFLRAFYLELSIALIDPISASMSKKRNKIFLVCFVFVLSVCRSAIVTYLRSLVTTFDIMAHARFKLCFRYTKNHRASLSLIDFVIVFRAIIPILNL